MNDGKYAEIKAFTRQHTKRAKNRGRLNIDFFPQRIPDEMATEPILDEGPPPTIRLNKADYIDLVARADAEDPNAPPDD